MTITAHNKYIDTACLSGLFTQGEKYSDKIYFSVDRVNNDVDLTDCKFTLRAVNENGNMTDSTLDKSVQESNILLTWEVSEYITARAGALHLEIIGIKGESIIIKYKMKPITIRNSILGEGLPEPDVIEKKLIEMQEILNKAQEIAVKTPYIQDNTWYIWSISENQYVNSGVSALGCKGDKGDPGADGIDGTPGKDGQDSLSAYELWIANGNTGTISDFLNSLKGEKGDPGADGTDGTSGEDGQNGLSAYEIWLSLGNTGSEAEFIEALKGLPGTDGRDGVDGVNGENGKDGADGFSPEASISAVDSVITIIITDKNGTTKVSFTAPDQSQLDAISQSVAALHSVDISLESRIAALEASGGGECKRITLYSANAHESYLNNIYIKLNDTIYNISEFTNMYPDFCSESNNYGLYYFVFLGWDVQVYTCSNSPIRITPNSLIAMTFIAGSTEIGILRLVQSISGSPDDILEKAQTEGSYIDLSFQWLYSDTAITTLSSCENVPTGEYYLVWVGRSNNSHPLISGITIIS